MTKPFLLVFHGGLVCYLFLHNFIIPIMRNWGQGNPFLQETGYYFVPHFYFWWVLSRLSFQKGFYEHKKEFHFPFSLSLNLTIALGSLGLWLMKLKDKLTPQEFSTGISLAAMGFFFLGFFSYFKNFFSMNWYKPKREYLTGFILGLGFIFLQNSLEFSAPIKEESQDKRLDLRQQRGAHFTLHLALPSHSFTGEQIRLTTEGLERPLSLLPLKARAFLVNETEKKYLVRIEYLRNQRWYFKKVVNLRAKQTFPLDFVQRGIYKLHLPTQTHSKHPFHILVKGSNLFEKKSYLLRNKNVEIEDE